MKCSSFSPEVMVDPSPLDPDTVVCEECQPDLSTLEAPLDDVVTPQEGVNFQVLSAVNETTRASTAIPSSPGYPKAWDDLVFQIRSSPCRIFWEIFSGCGIISRKTFIP